MLMAESEPRGVAINLHSGGPRGQSIAAKSLEKRMQEGTKWAASDGRAWDPSSAQDRQYAKKVLEMQKLRDTSAQKSDALESEIEQHEAGATIGVVNRKAVIWQFL